MNYVGVDYHKTYSHVTAGTPAAHVARFQRLPNTAESFKTFFAGVEVLMRQPGDPPHLGNHVRSFGESGASRVGDAGPCL
jgi:hypothetical protein